MGKINVHDKIMIENQKKRNYGNHRIFLHKSPSNRWFRNGIHSMLRWADARRCTDIYYMWRISLLCGSDTVNEVTK